MTYTKRITEVWDEEGKYYLTVEEYDNDELIQTKTETKKISPFSIPTVEEIYEYMLSIEYPNAKDESLKFHNYYSKRNWRINSEPMLGWKYLVNNIWKVNYSKEENYSKMTGDF